MTQKSDIKTKGKTIGINAGNKTSRNKRKQNETREQATNYSYE